MRRWRSAPSEKLRIALAPQRTDPAGGAWVEPVEPRQQGLNVDEANGHLIPKRWKNPPTHVGLRTAEHQRLEHDAHFLGQNLLARNERSGEQESVKGPLCVRYERERVLVVALVDDELEPGRRSALAPLDEVLEHLLGARHREHGRELTAVADGPDDGVDVPRVRVEQRGDLGRVDELSWESSKQRYVRDEDEHRRAYRERRQPYGFIIRAALLFHTLVDAPIKTAQWGVT